MSPASHVVGRLRELYGVVLGKMQQLDNQPAIVQADNPALSLYCLLGTLEKRVLLTGDR